MSTYRGLSGETRRTERRSRLVAAGLDLWGEAGWQGVTVRGVCARAGLTDRYFYENFADRDTLLLAVFDQVRDEIITLMFEVPWTGDPRAIMRATFTEVLAVLAADPRKARVGFTESAGSPALERRRHEAVGLVAEALAGKVSTASAPPPPGTVTVALFCAGGVGELISAWLADRLDLSAAQLVDHCTTLCAAAFNLP
ncbi:MAG: TetR/AcrR family transcriptional regulator [Streptosporangiaceae bacterium]